MRHFGGSLGHDARAELWSQSAPANSRESGPVDVKQCYALAAAMKYFSERFNAKEKLICIDIALRNKANPFLSVGWCEYIIIY